MSYAKQYKRPLFEVVLRRLREPRRFLQVLCGPRQSGKTTLIRQVLDSLDMPTHYASADEPGLRPLGWIAEQWELGRLKIRRGGEVVVVLDEIQKVPGWSATVKRLWDEDSARGSGVKVVALGSAPLLMQRGLSESLAGRFQVPAIPHWSYPEMRDAFGWDLDRFIFFGGYPGSAALIDDEQRWARYVVDSLIETTISRDVFHMARVDKPALLRRLFQFGCEYSGQVLSYQKMLGQLQESSNTTTLAHYLDLLSGAGMIAGIPKFAGQKVRQRGSSPKLMVLNTALMSALSHFRFEEARRERSFWGRLVRSCR